MSDRFCSIATSRADDFDCVPSAKYGANYAEEAIEDDVCMLLPCTSTTGCILHEVNLRQVT